MIPRKSAASPRLRTAGPIRAPAAVSKVNGTPLLPAFGHAFDGCLLRNRHALVPVGALVGPTRASRGSPGRARRGRGRHRRFARRTPRRAGPHADPTASGPVPVRPALARGGWALGLLPARHLPGGRRGGHLRSGLPAGALARRGTGAAGGAGVRAESVPGL